MQTFRCHCGNTIYFTNTQCLVCGRLTGFIPARRTMSAFEPAGGELWRSLAPASVAGLFRLCDNYAVQQVCNWVVSADDQHRFCESCRLNRVIPNLSDPKNHRLWFRIERAKRHLVYNLQALRLPIVDRSQDVEGGLAFQFMEDIQPVSGDGQRYERVLTGHAAGVITINIAEADPSAREEMREKMHEKYRTLLGHFRHEIGHYYWERLVNNDAWLPAFRALFGDERQDYDAALQRHYGSPLAAWSDAFITQYASAHPWEDWAETWAHYLHMVDTLDTASAFGFGANGRAVEPPDLSTADFDRLTAQWGGLTIAMNALNESMGLPPAYPFALAPRIVNKLRFVHQVVRERERYSQSKRGSA